MDEIRIQGLQVYAHHGLYPEETKLGQRFLVNAVLFCDTRPAGKQDDLTLSMDYGAIAGEITSFLTEHTYHLLEAAAEALCAHLLTEYKGLKRITVELQKPWASIGLPLETVSVRITRGRHRAYLSLGSNMGDSKAYLSEALQKLDATEGIQVEQVSAFIKTKPYGGVEQEDFLNACAALTTLLTPEELLSEMNRIEAEAGRERTIHWGPRTLDLDMIFYDDLVTEDPRLLLPHPDMANRAFVLGPLNELCPYKRHPVTKLTVREMLERLEGKEHE